MSSISFDRAADFYDATRGYSERTAGEIAAALCEAGPLMRGSSVLEIGIGTGRIAIPLLARGVNVSGVDIAPRMLGRLRANLAAREAIAGHESTGWGALDARVADMTALPFAGATFDAVIAVHVFHLVGHWEHALDEALRMLRSDGVLLLGQDHHPGSLAYLVFDRWLTILRELGATAGMTAYIGASGDQVRRDLRVRGLFLSTTTPVHWVEPTSPNQAVDYLALRQPSRTWRVPEDLFAASIARLREWVNAEYREASAEPVPDPASFSLTRASKLAPAQ